MKSILFLIETIFSNINISGKKRFSQFFFHFLILKIFKKKKITLIVDVFLNLRTPENVIR